MINILAIESSCDDTSAAVISDGKILSNVIANQKVHEEFGGVVPELASRQHHKHIIPVVDVALKRANMETGALSAIAYTQGPGLIGSLLVGSTFGKTMALSLGIPFIAVHHMRAHVLAHFIDDPKPEFPFLCLTVSGGHTQLVLVKDHLQMEVVGETLDDAAGEAFDKTAKMFGLPYPGGIMIDKNAAKGEAVFEFAKPSVPEFNFSFSGLKTSVLYFLKKQDQSFIEKNMFDLCASVQKTIVDVLLKTFIKAAKHYKITNVAIAGGVSANSELRKRFLEEAGKRNWNAFIPKIEYCTDNAAMIAMTAHYKYLVKDFADHQLSPVARWNV